MYPFGNYKPKEEALVGVLHGPKKVPQACIRKVNDRSYCGHYFTSDEFYFNDAEYAVRNYSESITLVACPACVHAFKAINDAPADKGAFVRGMGNDR